MEFVCRASLDVSGFVLADQVILRVWMCVCARVCISRRNFAFSCAFLFVKAEPFLNRHGEYPRFFTSIWKGFRSASLFLFIYFFLCLN